MICVICQQSEVVDGFTSVRLERGELRLVVSHVPARVCQSCGEADIEEAIAIRVLQSAEDAQTAGILNGRYKYGGV